MHKSTCSCWWVGLLFSNNGLCRYLPQSNVIHQKPPTPKSCITSNEYNLTIVNVNDEWVGFSIQATTHPPNNLSFFVFIVEVNKKCTLYIILYMQGTFRYPGQDLDLCLTQFCPVMKIKVVLQLLIFKGFHFIFWHFVFHF